MPKKPRERFKDRFHSKSKTKADADPAASAQSSSAIEIVRRRRNKRFLFVALVGISFPIFELIAYRYRAITVSFTNRSEQVIRWVKVGYEGGSFELPEIKPGGVAVRVIRPDFQFKSQNFSTYPMTIRVLPENGHIIGLIGRAGALDYSATELYTLESTPPNGEIQIKHTTRPGFPLGAVRDLMERLGFK